MINVLQITLPASSYPGPGWNNPSGRSLNTDPCLTKASQIVSYPHIVMNIRFPKNSRNMSPYVLFKRKYSSWCLVPMRRKNIKFPTNGRARGPGMSVRGVEITQRAIRNNNVMTRKVVRSMYLASEAPVVQSENSIFKNFKTFWINLAPFWSVCVLLYNALLPLCKRKRGRCTLYFLTHHACYATL